MARIQANASLQEKKEEAVIEWAALLLALANSP